MVNSNNSLVFDQFFFFSIQNEFKGKLNKEHGREPEVLLECCEKVLRFDITPHAKPNSYFVFLSPNMLKHDDAPQAKDDLLREVILDSFCETFRTKSFPGWPEQEFTLKLCPSAFLSSLGLGLGFETCSPFAPAIISRLVKMALMRATRVACKKVQLPFRRSLLCESLVLKPIVPSEKKA